MSCPTYPVEHLSYDQLTWDRELQARCGLDQDHLADLARAWERGDALPPGVAYYDGSHYWPADGWHRAHGALVADLPEPPRIPFEVRPGDRRAALFHALTAANHRHGLRRSNADKRRAVELMLADREWARWSNRKVADHLGVSDGLVRDVKAAAARARCAPDPGLLAEAARAAAARDGGGVGTARRLADVIGGLERARQLLLALKLGRRAEDALQALRMAAEQGGELVAGVARVRAALEAARLGELAEELAGLLGLASAETKHLRDAA